MYECGLASSTSSTSEASASRATKLRSQHRTRSDVGLTRICGNCETLAMPVIAAPRSATQPLERPMRSTRPYTGRDRSVTKRSKRSGPGIRQLRGRAVGKVRAGDIGGGGEGEWARAVLNRQMPGGQVRHRHLTEMPRYVNRGPHMLLLSTFFSSLHPQSRLTSTSGSISLPAHTCLVEVTTVVSTLPQSSFPHSITRSHPIRRPRRQEQCPA